MIEIVLMLPPSQANENDILLLVALFLGFRQIFHGFHMNEAISLLVFSPVVSGDELGRTHANGVQLSDPVLQHHDLGVESLRQVVKYLFLP